MSGYTLFEVAESRLKYFVFISVIDVLKRATKKAIDQTMALEEMKDKGDLFHTLFKI